MAENTSTHPAPSLTHLFWIFLRLGCTSFGGPVAHLAYFREEFVQRRRWFTDQAYADLVALCQFLPGPASSQVGMGIGLTMGGYRGAVLAWLGFTLPSALLLIAFAMSLSYGEWLNMGALQGLKIVAVAVVIQACWGMARQLCPDTQRQIWMLLAACCATLISGISGQLLVIAGGALLGLMYLRAPLPAEPRPEPLLVAGHKGWLILFAAGLVLLPWLASTGEHWAEIFSSFYRTGSLVFGGGHVVLPLLQAEVVPHWVDAERFMAGYGAAQAVPGPLFTFAAYLGALSHAPEASISAGLLAVCAIFLPSFLLIFGLLRWWQQVLHIAPARAAVNGINAAVVGLLLAALYDPVWTSAIYGPQDFVWLLLALLALHWAKLPPWLVVIASGSMGAWLL